MKIRGERDVTPDHYHTAPWPGRHALADHSNRSMERDRCLAERLSPNFRRAGGANCALS